MRDIFCKTMIDQSVCDPRTVFLTGDLGFQALEPLAAVLGDRFINAGIAEQNMISMAAGMAHNGCHPWCYSIAPFIYARPFEQIRNDLGLHNLSVKLVGNGGGYGYGVMGATHHAIEDYGSLLGIQHMRCYVPAFDTDVEACIRRMWHAQGPGYLRLGRQEYDPGFAVNDYSPWRQLVKGQSYNQKPVIVAVGPIAGTLLKHLTNGVGEHDPDPTRCSHRHLLWAVSEMPIMQIPREFLMQISHRVLIVVEEHVEHGGFGQQLIAKLAKDYSVNLPAGFRQVCAKGYPSGRYGSQKFHRFESSLDVESICKI